MYRIQNFIFPQSCSFKCLWAMTFVIMFKTQIQIKLLNRPNHLTNINWCHIFSGYLKLIWTRKFIYTYIQYKNINFSLMFKRLSSFFSLLIFDQVYLIDYLIFLFSVISMDVTCSSSSWFDTSSGNLLFGFGTTKLSTKNTTWWNPSVWDETKVFRRHSSSRKCVTLSAHLRYEFTKT